MTEDQLPPGGIEIGDDPAWEAWHPADVARLLTGVPAIWFVAGGWALDLHRGAQAREHGDLEIAVPAGDDTVGPIRQALAACDFEVVGVSRSPLDSAALPKDEADLCGTLPLLEPEARDWLRLVLHRVHPGHAWIEEL